MKRVKILLEMLFLLSSMSFATGVQLGLINMVKTGFFPIFPFINIDGRLF